MTPKPEPHWICPLCQKKFFTREQSICCADADIKEALAKTRRLRKLEKPEKPYNK